MASEAGSERGETEFGTKKVEVKAGADGDGKKKSVGDGEMCEEKPVVVDVSEGDVKMDSSGDKKDDTKKSEEGSTDPSDQVTPAITNATKPADGTQQAPAETAVSGPEKPTTTTDEKDDAAKDRANPVFNGEDAERILDGKTTKLKEPPITDEGDIATPKRATKELPASPGKTPNEKPLPTLGLTVPKSPKSGGSTLSPLQQALDDAENETLMERMARLKIVNASYQPPKDVTPPAPTDGESEFECETAPSGPSTPRSRGGKGSFNLVLRSDVPLSDDDEFFLDCDSNASVSNFDGL